MMMMREEMETSKTKGGTDGIANIQIYHVPYKQLVSQPMDLIASIHKTFGVPLSTEQHTRVADYIKSHAQHSRGIHRYSRAGLGLEEKDLEQGFALYKEYFA